MHTAACGEGSWNKKLEDQKQILASSAKIAAQDSKLKLLQKQKKILDKTSTSTTETADGETTKPWAWKDKPPKSGENPQKKVVEGKEFHFCKFHNDGKGKWVQHAAEKCKNYLKNECYSGMKKVDKLDTSNAENPITQTSDCKQVAKLAIIESLKGTLDKM